MRADAQLKAGLTDVIFIFIFFAASAAGWSGGGDPNHDQTSD